MHLLILPIPRMVLKAAPFLQLPTAWYATTALSLDAPVFVRLKPCLCWNATDPSTSCPSHCSGGLRLLSARLPEEGTSLRGKVTLSPAQLRASPDHATPVWTTATCLFAPTNLYGCES